MRIKRTLTLAVSIYLCLTCMAEQNQQSGQSRQSTILLVKKNRGASTIRPKAPDRQVVTCAYNGEDVELSLTLPEGNATLYITDQTHSTKTYEIETAPLEVNVATGELMGRISIEMSTEKGNIYIGEIE